MTNFSNISCDILNVCFTYLKTCEFSYISQVNKHWLNACSVYCKTVNRRPKCVEHVLNSQLKFYIYPDDEISDIYDHYLNARMFGSILIYDTQNKVKYVLVDSSKTIKSIYALYLKSPDIPLIRIYNECKYMKIRTFDKTQTICCKKCGILTNTKSCSTCSVLYCKLCLDGEFIIENTIRKCLICHNKHV